MTIAASLPEGAVLVATAVPTTLARTLTPSALEDRDPEVKVVRASPRLRPPEVVVVVVTATGDTYSPPPVPEGLTIEKATCALPTGRLLRFVTVAIRVEYGQVVPTHFPTRLGEACSVTLYGVVAVMATVRLSLVAVAATSYTWILATPATAVVRVAHARPAPGVMGPQAGPFTGTDKDVPEPFQLPMVVVNCTLAVGRGALTSTISESPICMVTAVGLSIPICADTEPDAVAAALISKLVLATIDATVALSGMPVPATWAPTAMELVLPVVTVVDVLVVVTHKPPTPHGEVTAGISSDSAMPKVTADDVTVTGADAVAPTALPVTVTAPAAPPATETIYCPLLSVTPAGLVTGVIVTVPAPAVLVTEIAAPETGIPPASLAVKVMVTGEPLPPVRTVLPLAFTVRVEPTIFTGSVVFIPPDEAVIVAVRLDLLAVPEEKVKVALPAASVVTVWVLRMPVSALRLITTFGVAASAALSAVRVTVVEFELSDLTVVGEAESESELMAVAVETTEKRAELLVTVVPPTWAAAEMVVEPSAAPAADSVAVATPRRLVCGVAGVTVASDALAISNVMGVLVTTAPVPSSKVAFTVAGEPVEIVFDDRLIVKLGVLIVAEKLVEAFTCAPPT